MARVLLLSIVFLFVISPACDQPEVTNPDRASQLKPGFLGDPPGSDAPDCDPCSPTDIWCEDWELSCHLPYWTEVSNNLTRISTDRYSGLSSAKHNFRVSNNPTLKIFANSYNNITVEFAVKFSPNFFPTGTQGGGKHFWRLKCHVGVNEEFNIDNDFAHVGATPFFQFIFFTPQNAGPRYEWPTTSIDRLLIDMAPYRNKWGKFKYVITLNTPLQSNGSFYFYEWVSNQWQVRKSFVNVNILGPDPNTALTSFKTFHWSNYNTPFLPEDEAYWLTDDLRIYQ